jgi:hypothetical protein
MASWEDDIIISPVGGAPVSVLQGGNPPWLNDRVDQKGNPLRLPEEESTIKDWICINFNSLSDRDRKCLGNFQRTLRGNWASV